MKSRVALCFVVLLLYGVHSALALDIALPTANDALFRGKPEEFYMHVNRWIDGTQTMAWEGGQYGFVRDPRQTPQGLVYTRFHAGIDIRPLERDAQGNPLDTIHAIASGRVVHTSPDRRASNFGCYLVIEHQWDGCPYYSLYAHLSDIYVTPGMEVAKGEKIAKMGFTGRGIDRERAHVHLEVALMLNEHFDGFSNTQWGASGNRHGNFNGINLQGIDVARLYTESRANPALTIPEFLAKEEAFFHVDLPGNYPVDLLKRYPWMAVDQPVKANEPPAGWRVFISRAGIPLKVQRLNEAVQAIAVGVEKPSEQPLNYLTYGLISGKGATATLASRGKQFISLLTFEPQAIPVDGAPPSQLPPLRERTHTVKKGETLLAIASAYKVAVAELRKANRIENPKLLKAGQHLVIPAYNGQSFGNPGGETGGH